MAISRTGGQILDSRHYTPVEGMCTVGEIDDPSLKFLKGVEYLRNAHQKNIGVKLKKSYCLKLWQLDKIVMIIVQ